MQNLSFDVPARIASFHGVALKLSPQEYDLLLTLAVARGDVVRRADIFATIAQNAEDDGKLVDVVIYKLRKKMARVNNAHGIVTFPGTGYAYREGVAPKALAPSAPGDSFHKACMTKLDSAQGAGAALPTMTHYVMRETLRRAHMNGAPIQNEQELAEAMAAFYARRSA